MEDAVSNLTMHVDTVFKSYFHGCFFHQLFLPLVSGLVKDFNYRVLLLMFLVNGHNAKKHLSEHLKKKMDDKMNLQKDLFKGVQEYYAQIYDIKY